MPDTLGGNASVLQTFGGLPARVPAGTTLQVGITGGGNSLITFDETSLNSGLATIRAYRFIDLGGSTFAAITCNGFLSLDPSSGRFLRGPAATQTLIAGTAITHGSSVSMISTGSNIVSTAAPTISDDNDGAQLMLINVGAFNYTISDQGTLASSNLRLTAATIVMTPRSSIQLMYSATIGDWVQVGPLVSVI